MEEIQEIWKDAVSSRYPDYVKDLRVSNKGSVRKAHTLFVYTQRLNKDGHLTINKCNKEITVHSLVIETFVSIRPPDMVIDHIDAVKTNNIVSNLRYVSNLENSRKGNLSLEEYERKKNSDTENKVSLDDILIRLEKIEESQRRIEVLLTKMYNGNIEN